MLYYNIRNIILILKMYTNIVQMIQIVNIYFNKNKDVYLHIINIFIITCKYLFFCKTGKCTHIIIFPILV